MLMRGVFICSCGMECCVIVFLSVDLSIDQRKVLKYPKIIAVEFTSLFQYTNISSLKANALGLARQANSLPASAGISYGHWFMV